MKITITALTIMSLMIVGCDRYLDSATPTEPEPVELLSPINVTVSLNDQAVSLNWEHSDSAQVTRFRLYTFEALDSTYTLQDSTTAYSYTFSNLLSNRTHYFSIAGVGTNGIEGRRSTPISAWVGPLSITIDAGNQFTNRKQVQVQLNSNSLSTHVMLSEDSTMADAVYESFSLSKSFVLSDGEGLKTVYARFLFSDGSTTGEHLSDDITLDLKAEITSVGYTPSGPFVTGDTIVFTLDATELEGQARVSITGGPTVPLYDDGLTPDPTSGDGIYTGKLIIQPFVVLTDARFTGSFTDLAGNSVSLVSDQVLNITTITNDPPDPVVLAGVLVDTVSIGLTWSESNAEDFASYRIYRDYVVMTDTSDGSMIEFVNDRRVTSFTDYVVEDTTYYYRIYVFDNQGAYSGSNVVSVTK